MSVWFLLLITLVPSYALIKQERFNILLTNTANQLVFEEIMRIKNESGVKENKVIQRDAISYVLDWSSDSESKLCVRWEDKRKRLEERCGYTNK